MLKLTLDFHLALRLLENHNRLNIALISLKY